MTRTVLIAGQGALPGILLRAMTAAGDPPLVAGMSGSEPDLPGAQVFRLERLAVFLDSLVDAGVSRAVFAGSVRRPPLDLEAFDPRTAQLVPALLRELSRGDDAALRAILGLFEDWGISVVGADVVAPDLVPSAGLLAGTPTPADEADAARAAAIVEGLGALDIGQGAVVAQGLCLSVEALPGTDAMLDFVALHGHLRPDPAGARGVLYKAPKPGQDLRVDLPTLGRGTVERAARAGLAGIAWAAGSALLIDREATVAAARAAGLFLWSRPCGSS